MEKPYFPASTHNRGGMHATRSLALMACPTHRPSFHLVFLFVRCSCLDCLFFCSFHHCLVLAAHASPPPGPNVPLGVRCPLPSPFPRLSSVGRGVAGSVVNPLSERMMGLLEECARLRADGYCSRRIPDAWWRQHPKTLLRASQRARWLIYPARVLQPSLFSTYFIAGGVAWHRQEHKMAQFWDCTNSRT